MLGREHRLAAPPPPGSPAPARRPGASLSRKPLAPARSASTTYSSRSKVVSTSTFAGPSCPGPVICRVASTPSIRGIRMSISTTSGCSARTWSSACRPSPASPTTARSCSASRIIRKPVRSSGWSSTSRTRIGHEGLPREGQARSSPIRRPASARRPLRVPRPRLGQSRLDRSAGRAGECRRTPGRRAWWSHQSHSLLRPRPPVAGLRGPLDRLPQGQQLALHRAQVRLRAGRSVSTSPLPR